MRWRRRWRMGTWLETANQRVSQPVLWLVLELKGSWGEMPWADDITHLPPQLTLTQLLLFSGTSAQCCFSCFLPSLISQFPNASLVNIFIFTLFWIYTFSCLIFFPFDCHWKLSIPVIRQTIFFSELQLRVYKIEDIPPSPGFTPWPSRLPSPRYPVSASTHFINSLVPMALTHFRFHRSSNKMHILFCFYLSEIRSKTRPTFYFTVLTECKSIRAERGGSDMFSQSGWNEFVL